MTVSGHNLKKYSQRTNETYLYNGRLRSIHPPGDWSKEPLSSKKVWRWSWGACPPSYKYFLTTALPKDRAVYAYFPNYVSLDLLTNIVKVNWKNRLVQSEGTCREIFWRKEYDKKIVNIKKLYAKCEKVKKKSLKSLNFKLGGLGAKDSLLSPFLDFAEFIN